MMLGGMWKGAMMGKLFQGLGGLGPPLGSWQILPLLDLSSLHGFLAHPSKIGRGGVLRHPHFPPLQIHSGETAACLSLVNERPFKRMPLLPGSLAQ